MSRYVFTSESVGEGHPDKVCYFIADSILDAHLAADARSRVACEVLVKTEPTSVRVNTGDAGAAEALVRSYDFRPRAIIEQFDLLRPIYRQTANYGHFGKAGLSWEA